VTAQFGGLTISFRQLLHNLQYRCGCQVVRLDSGGIPDTDESVSGALYEVTRTEGSIERYAHIEVHSENLPVLPDLLRSICVQLDLPQERVLGRGRN
jgi:hypothetical protein